MLSAGHVSSREGLTVVAPCESVHFFADTDTDDNVVVPMTSRGGSVIVQCIELASELLLALNCYARVSLFLSLGVMLCTHPRPTTVPKHDLGALEPQDCT